MLNIQVDERAIRRLYLEKLEEKLKEVDAEFVFWDTSELEKERACRGLLFKKNSFLISVFKNLKCAGHGIFRLKKRKHFY
ncbi:group-specific protein [Bacillus paranthracis]|uniref:group-specific protein n=1 Tax=Bacillus paranthracis TaxID=2026186 RepID=UPI003DA85D6A